MTVETSVWTALNALNLAGGVWPNTAKDSDICPRVVFSRVSGVPELTFAFGLPSMETIRLQVDCYEVTYAAVKTLAENVKTVMAALQPTVSNWLLNDMDAYETDVKQHRVVLEFGMRG